MQTEISKKIFSYYLCKNARNFFLSKTIPGVTSDDQLSREVGGVSSVCGQAGVATTVGGLQAEEEDVAAEDIILNLDVSSSLEISAVFVPLNLYGHVARGYGAGHLRSVSLLQISIEREGRNLGRFDGP